MTVARFARFLLYSFGLLLLCLSGVGIYCYQNLSEIAEQQARDYLRPYGIEDLSLQQLNISPQQLYINQLWLRGERDGLRFEATLKVLDVHFDWRKLMDGELESVALNSLQLAIENSAENSTANSDKLAGSVNTRALLPQTYLPELPLNTLTIKQWQVNYQSPELSPIVAQGHLQMAEQVHLRMETSHQDSQLKLDLISPYQSEPNKPALDASFWLYHKGTELAQLTTQLTARLSDQSGLQVKQTAADEWQWQVQGTAQFDPVLTWLRQLAKTSSSPSIADKVVLHGQSNFSATINHPNQFSVPAAPGLDSLAGFSTTITVSNNIKQLDYPALIKALSGQVTINTEIKNGQLQATIDPTRLTGKLHTKALSLPVDTQKWLGWPKTIPMQWHHTDPIRIHYREGEQWQIQLHNSQLVVGNSQSDLHWTKVNLDIQRSESSGQLNTQLQARLNSRLHKQSLPALKLALDQQGSLKKSTFNLSLNDIAASMNLTLQGKLNPTSGQGNYRLRAGSMDLPYATSSLMPLLKKFDLLQQKVAITSGTVQLNSTITSRNFNPGSWRHQSQIDLKNLSGSVDEYQFTGMAANANWSGLKRWKTNKPVTLTLDYFDAGVALRNIQTQITTPEATSITTPKFLIKQFSADIFGGRIYLPEPQDWDFTARVNQLTLHAEQWQLADLIALQQNKDIQGNGSLQGELPFSFTAGRIVIKKGYLHALAPGGEIRYLANDASRELAATSPELGMTLDLLSDFQYNLLNSEVTLDKQGNLLLGLSISGKNPAKFKGRAINFNINIEQNLDPLLQSLRLSDKLEEEIEDRLR